jgi:hypothetical protein
VLRGLLAGAAQGLAHGSRSGIDEVTGMADLVRDYVEEAIDVEKSGPRSWRAKASAIGDLPRRAVVAPDAADGSWHRVGRGAVEPPLVDG